LASPIRVTHTLPCLADPAKIRFHAEPSADLEPVLPYLNAVMQGAVYNHEARALTFTKEDRIISVFPRRITGSKALDVQDACAILDWLRGLINDTWSRREEITPSCERRQRLTALAVYKLLPGTNCRQCGLPTCLAFAVELTSERASIMKCDPLFLPENSEKRELLLDLLRDAGYELPGAFTPPAPTSQHPPPSMPSATPPDCRPPAQPPRSPGPGGGHHG
jgi:ArsR family metal-binding transcriptional regulator